MVLHYHWGNVNFEMINAVPGGFAGIIGSAINLIMGLSINGFQAIDPSAYPQLEAFDSFAYDIENLI